MEARRDAIAGQRLLTLEPLPDRREHRHLPVGPLAVAFSPTADFFAARRFAGLRRAVVFRDDAAFATARFRRTVFFDFFAVDFFAIFLFMSTLWAAAR